MIWCSESLRLALAPITLGESYGYVLDIGIRSDTPRHILYTLFAQEGDLQVPEPDRPTTRDPERKQRTAS